jgi:hypothetical protein
MEFKGEKVLKKSKTPASSIIMYVGSIIVALIAIASLINNVLLFKTSITDYVAQGYKKAQILPRIIPGQLLPAIFEAVAVYGGIAFILLCAGIINHKLSKSLNLLSIDKDIDDIEKNSIDKKIIEINTEQNDVNEEISDNN